MRAGWVHGAGLGGHGEPGGASELRGRHPGHASGPGTSVHVDATPRIFSTHTTALRATTTVLVSVVYHLLSYPLSFGDGTAWEYCQLALEVGEPEPEQRFLGSDSFHW